MPLIILTDLQWRASPDGPKIRMSAACEAPNVPSEAVEDHRFCTDCWEAAGRLGACCEAIYTLVLTNIAMENHNFL